MKMLAENIMKLNPKFQITVRGVEWPVYLNANRHKTMPIFFIGWAPDYPDPADYVFPYMSSSGRGSSNERRRCCRRPKLHC